MSNNNFDLIETYYNKICIPANITNIKIDIGLSYNAPQSGIWLDKEPNLLVIGFEPNPECVQSILSKNIIKRQNYHDDPIKSEYIDHRFFLFPFALSSISEPSSMKFYSMQQDCGTSSLFKPTWGLWNEIDVPVYSLKHLFDIFDWNRFPYIDYIKIDAQGGDLDILKGAGIYLKDRVVYITAEAEHKTYENCNHNNIAEFDKYLLSQNFIRVSHPNTDDPTYINNDFLHLKDTIFIYQKG
jgi:FkbM family methyltransferase